MTNFIPVEFITLIERFYYKGEEKCEGCVTNDQNRSYI